MKFAALFWLPGLLLLVPGLILLWRWSAARRRQQLDRIIAPRLRDQLLASVDFARRRWKQVLLVLALSLLIVALARPQMGHREVRVELPGIDYFVAMDISKSMLAEDAAGTNRITAVKAALTRLLERPSGDRIGLIAFAGEAFLVSPISQDHGAIERSINALTTTSVSKPGTDLAAAIRLAIKSFEKKQEAGKAILLISDGEELQGDAVIAAREAVQDKIAVFTVGAGTALGARIPDRSTGALRFAKNEFGREVNSRLNERVLQQVAAAGKGAYAHLDPGGDALLHLYERGLKLLPKGTHVRKSQDMQEAYQWPLGGALVLLLIEMLVSERKKRLT